MQANLFVFLVFLMIFAAECAVLRADSEYYCESLHMYGACAELDSAGCSSEVGLENPLEPKIPGREFVKIH